MLAPPGSARVHQRPITILDRVNMKRSQLLAPVVVLILTISAIAAVWLLVERASSSRVAQLQVSAMKLSAADFLAAPFSADPATGGSPTASRTRISADDASISRGLANQSTVGVPGSLLRSGRADLTAVEAAVTSIYRVAVQNGGLAAAGPVVPRLNRLLIVRTAALSGVLAKISRTDANRAATARTQTKFGAAAALLLLLAAFAFFYFRSVAARKAVERLAGENQALLAESRDEAKTDALTSLGNRRALTHDLALAFAEPAGPHELLLIMLDLDGFKRYNDTFGHAAGDSLLERLGTRLAAATERAGSAYRMGGDEFCVLARCSPEAAEQLMFRLSTALEERGEGWDVGCSQGAAWMPSEAATETLALNLADERMYADKAGRSSSSRSGSSASRQVTDALLQVITEQDAQLDEHVERVAVLSGAVAEALGQPEHEVQRIRVAAKLHDVGKTAIPATILDKPGPLDEREWEFMRRHPLIGERIVTAAPALANTASLIRSSHERFDGHGYPDGLAGEKIPLGSRIIAVCDTFDAMSSDRSYRPRVGVDEALQELKRNAGSQFDAAVVDAFCTEVRRDLATIGAPAVSVPV
jgi:diguanylate cyclase (GGDEF)-like protein